MHKISTSITKAYMNTIKFMGLNYGQFPRNYRNKFTLHSLRTPTFAKTPFEFECYGTTNSKNIFDIVTFLKTFHFQ